MRIDTSPNLDADESRERELARVLELPPDVRAAAIADLRKQSPELAASLEACYAFLLRNGFVRMHGAIPDRLGDFRLLEPIGKGGMGVVYLAEQVSLGRRVALKLIRPEIAQESPEARQRFLREARATAGLRHDSIVRIYAFDDGMNGDDAERGIPYIAMEWVEGRPLNELLERVREVRADNGGSTEPAAVAKVLGRTESEGMPELFQGSWFDFSARVAERVADALQHAHDRSLLHRDVKPSNVMLTRDGRVVLLDFGLAKDEDAVELTQSGVQPGSLAYMAPELALRSERQASCRSDVYSLGAVLFECLTLRRAHPSTTAAGVLRQIESHDVPRLRRIAPDAPRDLEAIVSTATEREPGRRYDGAGGLAADLRSLLAGEPVVARPISRARRLSRSARRHQTSLAWLVAILVLALLGAGWFESWRTARAASDASRAELALARALVSLTEAEGGPCSDAGEALALRPGSPVGVAIVTLHKFWCDSSENAQLAVDAHRSVVREFPQLGWIEAAILRQQGRDPDALAIERTLPPGDELASFCRAMLLWPRIRTGDEAAIERATALMQQARMQSPGPRLVYDVGFAAIAANGGAGVGDQAYEVLSDRWPNVSVAATLAARCAPATDLDAKFAAMQHAVALHAANTGDLVRLLFLRGERRRAEELAKKRLAIVPGDPSVLRALACNALDDESPGEAIALAQRAVGEARTPANLRVLGSCLQRARRFAAARAAYAEALEQMVHPATLHGIGECCVATGDLRSARRALERATSLAPSRATSWKTLGDVRVQLGEDEPAVFAFRRAIELDGNPSARESLGRHHHRKGRYSEAAREYAAVLESPGLSAERRLRARREYACALTRAYEFRRAHAQFERLLEHYSDTEILSFAAEAASRSGHDAAAEKLVQRLLAIRSEQRLSDTEYARLGVAIRKCRRLELALKIVEEGRRAHPRSTRLRVEYANALRDSGRHAEAVREARAAVRLSPSSHVVRLQLGNILIEAGKRDEAFVQLAIARCFSQEEVKAGNLLSMNLVAAGFRQEAMDLLDGMISRGTTDKWTYYRRGCLEKNARSALAHFERALAFDPELESAKLRAGQSLRSIGKYREALRYFDAVLATTSSRVTTERAKKGRAACLRVLARRSARRSDDAHRELRKRSRK